MILMHEGNVREAEQKTSTKTMQIFSEKGERAMKIDTEMVQRWLDAYTHAWTTYDPDEIGALFTDAAEYRWHPWAEGDDVARGRSQIIAAWLESRDAAG